MKNSRPPSLVGFFKAQAIRSAVIGAILALSFASVITLYFAKTSIENKISTTALAISRSFRDPIVEGQAYRDIQDQIRNALDLKPGEAALILNKSFKEFYPVVEAQPSVSCRPEGYCWGKGFKDITYIQPIYSNEDKKEGIFGYLELRQNTVVDFKLLSLIFLSIIFIFGAQAFNLISSLSRGGKMIADRLRLWTGHLKNLRSVDSQKPVPFQELQEVQTEFDGLHFKITELEAKAAQEAKGKAQLSIIKQMGHDLTTPISQLSKYWLAHTHALKKIAVTTAAGFFTENIGRTIRRMDDIAAQVEDLNSDLKVVDEKDLNTNLVSETEEVVTDLGQLDEVIKKDVHLSFKNSGNVGSARVASVGLYRILVNLIRNAVGAVNVGGIITVSIYEDEGPTLSVKDNGCGVPEHIQKNIFDWDFSTTKGAGLGLGMVKQICDRVGATVELKTEIGMGTEFIVKFKPSRVKESLYEVQNLSC